MSRYTLKVGDTIKCKNKTEISLLRDNLTGYGYITKFIEEKDGIKGLYILITGIE